MKVFDTPEKIPETFKMLSKCRNIYTFKFKWPYCKNNHKTGLCLISVDNDLIN